MLPGPRSIKIVVALAASLVWRVAHPRTRRTGQTRRRRAPRRPCRQQRRPHRPRAKHRQLRRMPLRPQRRLPNLSAYLCPPQAADRSGFRRREPAIYRQRVERRTPDVDVGWSGELLDHEHRDHPARAAGLQERPPPAAIPVDSKGNVIEDGPGINLVSRGDKIDPGRHRRKSSISPSPAPISSSATSRATSRQACSGSSP